MCALKREKSFLGAKVFNDFFSSRDGIFNVATCSHRVKILLVFMAFSRIHGRNSRDGGRERKNNFDRIMWIYFMLRVISVDGLIH